MAEVLARPGVKRETGFLYFIDKQGDVARSKMARGRDRVKGQQKVAKTGVKREAGWLYFLDKQGNVARVKMMRGRK